MDWQKLIEQARADYIQGARDTIRGRNGKIIWEPKNAPLVIAVTFLTIGLGVFVLGLLYATGILHGEGRTTVTVGRDTVGQFQAPWLLPMLFGTAFAVVGYTVAFGVNHFEIDTKNRTWENYTGTRPFVKREGSTFDAINHIAFGKEMLVPTNFSKGSSGGKTQSVWTARFVFLDRRPTLILPFFRLSTSVFNRDLAMELATELSERLELPLRDETGDAIIQTGSTASIPTMTSPIVADTPTEATRVTDELPFEIPRRPALSRVSVSIGAGKDVHLTAKRPLGITTRIVSSLIPIIVFAIFMLFTVVSRQTNSFSQHSDPMWRTQVGMDIAFAAFATFLFILLPIGMTYIVLRHEMVIKELVFEEDRLVLIETLFGKEKGRKIYQRSSVHSIGIEDGKGASISGNGFASLSSKIRQIRIGTSEGDVLLGDRLSDEDLRYLMAAIRALLHDTDRDRVLENLQLLELPAAPQNLARDWWKKQYRKSAFWSSVVAVLSLLNSYGHFLVVESRWVDDRNVLHYFVTSFWHTREYAESSTGTSATRETQILPQGFGGSTRSQGDTSLLETVGTRKNFRMELKTEAQAVAEEQRTVTANRVAKATGGKEKRRAEARTAAAHLPANPDAKALNSVGDKYQAVGDWENALRYFRRAATVAQSPQDLSYAHISAAFCLLPQDKEKETITELQGVIAVPGGPKNDKKMARHYLQEIQANRSKGALRNRILQPGEKFPGED